ncbi:hypothetical protein GW17_00049522, partial [Ensete ventricosum]
KTERLVARMPEAIRLAGVQVEIRKVEGTTFPEISTSKSPVNDGCTTAAHAFGRLTVGKLPRADG